MDEIKSLKLNPFSFRIFFYPIETIYSMDQHTTTRASENENIYEIEHEGVIKYVFDPQSPINSIVPQEEEKDGICVKSAIFCFYSGILNCFIGIFAFVVSIYIISYAMNSIYITVEFTNYVVVYDSFFGRPVSSTQYKSVPKENPKYTNNKISRIKHSDFKNLTDKKYHRGLLSPSRSLDRESGSILNIIPQLECHNAGVWSQFERYVDNDYLKKGKPVTTVAKYGFFFWAKCFDVSSGKLYVPSHLCKILDGVEYCMDHDNRVCGKKWCKQITPLLPIECIE
jgi:hypothetical protein